MSTSDGSIEIQVVGAIRLALEGAANDATVMEMVRWLVDQAPATAANETASVELFLTGVRALKGKFAVNG